MSFEAIHASRNENCTSYTRHNLASKATEFPILSTTSPNDRLPRCYTQLRFKYSSFTQIPSLVKCLSVPDFRTWAIKFRINIGGNRRLKSSFITSFVEYYVTCLIRLGTLAFPDLLHSLPAQVQNPPSNRTALVYEHHSSLLPEAFLRKLIYVRDFNCATAERVKAAENSRSPSSSVGNKCAERDKRRQ